MKLKLITTVQILTIAFFIYRAIAWGLEGSWNMVNWCIFGCILAFIVLQYAKLLQDLT